MLAMIQELWPSFANGRNLEVTAGLWQRLFADETYTDVTAAVFAYASNDERGYPPPVGALKMYIYRMHDDSPNEQEAWKLVREAIGNSTYNSVEEYGKLPEAVQRCVAGPQFLRDCAEMEVSQLDTVVCSQFLKAYRAEAAKTAELGKMPGGLRKLFGKAQEPALMNGAEPKALPGTEEPGDAVPCPADVKDKLEKLFSGGNA